MAAFFLYIATESATLTSHSFHTIILQLKKALDI